ncbi:MAG: TolC family protein, partial [Planctomycetes bacterium]|nr:TolC family protein [Planctomycetota bacterium]
LELERTRTKAAAATSRREASLATLADLIGLPASELRLSDRIEQVPVISRATVNSLVDAHPRLRRLNAEESALRALTRSAEIAWRPDIDAGVFAAREADADEFGARLVIAVPVWDRNQGGIAAASARVARVSAELAAARRAIASEIDAAWSRYERALALATVSSATLRQRSADLLGLATRGYAAGETGLLELLDVRRAALEIETERVGALAEAADAVNDLITAAGTEGILP